MTDLEGLKLKRDKREARVQKAEARQRSAAKKADDRVKVLVGAALLTAHAKTPIPGLMNVIDAFLTRPAERLAVLGEDGQGSEAFKRIVNR